MSDLARDGHKHMDYILSQCSVLVCVDGKGSFEQISFTLDRSPISDVYNNNLQ